MLHRIAALLLLLLALPAAARAAGPKLEDLPGYLPLEELGLLPREELTTEINLDGALLRLVAGATKDEDPELARLIEGLRAIRVQVAPLKAATAEKVRERIGRAVRWLEGAGWKSIVRAREEGAETYIYLKEVQGEVQGLAVLSFEPGGEAALVNIVGRFDPAQIGRLGQSLDLDLGDRGDRGDRGKASQEGKGKKPERE